MTEDLKAEFDRYVHMSNEIERLNECEIERLQGIIKRQETSLKLMERSLNNKEK